MCVGHRHVLVFSVNQSSQVSEEYTKHATPIRNKNKIEPTWNIKHHIPFITIEQRGSPPTDDGRVARLGVVLFVKTTTAVTTKLM